MNRDESHNYINSRQDSQNLVKFDDEHMRSSNEMSFRQSKNTNTKTPFNEKSKL